MNVSASVQRVLCSERYPHMLVEVYIVYSSSPECISQSILPLPTLCSLSCVDVDSPRSTVVPSLK